MNPKQKRKEKEEKIMESNSKSNKTTNDTYDVFIYQWLLEDVPGLDEEGRDDRYIDVAGYGLDTENRNVYIKLDRGSFKPWLSLKVNNDSNEYQLKKDVSKLCERIFRSEFTTSDIDKYDENTIFLEKTSINKKLYFYSVEDDMTVFRLYFP